MGTVAMKFDHVRLDVCDIERSAEYYTAALGLREVVRYTVDQRVILQVAPEGLPPGIELWQEAGLTPVPHRTQHAAFSVSDVPRLVEHVRSLGYPITEEPYRIGEETVAFLTDPDGHLIELNDFRGRGIAEAGSGLPARTEHDG
ncbi:VOC family protein [Kitasatospora viridis]|uniref:Glyoxalase/bleomycin resistance protein/dioxygenase superfamily protein n=1 Tax=Kitasatospora viridis TaxID=281105 RepID=A0A561TSS7_9ACTN|nr:VOC family protein [Kitasatospora viridis]TWF90169.1 glyoxalase/bleomycin resistance protein/dioxygenase superfamily protein [Kitasatospora viridis]